MKAMLSAAYWRAAVSSWMMARSSASRSAWGRLRALSAASEIALLCLSTSSQLTNFVNSGSRPAIRRTAGWSTRKVGRWRATWARKATSMSQSTEPSAPPLSGRGRTSRESSTALLSLRPGSARKIPARSSGDQEEGFCPKAIRSRPLSASSRRARICSNEPLASVSIGCTRPPLCTGISPNTRLSQDAVSPACAGAIAASRRAAVAVVFPRLAMKRTNENPNCQRSPTDMMSTDA